MIGKLTGVLLEKNQPQILIDCHGVGYEVDVPMSTFFQLPETRQPVTLLTHLVVREDAHVLYGFMTIAERELFRMLINTVSGIGPKIALNILSGVSATAFRGAVANSDVKSLSQISGVGKKTAERLVVELKDKMQQLAAVAVEEPAAPSGPADDLVSALLHLGYSRPEAERGVEGAAGNLKQAEDRHSQLLHRRETRRREMERQRALTLQGVRSPKR